MLKRFFILIISVFLSSFLFAQNLTGVWQGYFITGFGPNKHRYKFEVQINNKANDALEAVTYSYKSTVFYGKAAAQGVFMKKQKTLVLKETKLIELKIEEFSSPCLMTCYLDYSKEGKLEVLEGTYSSVVIQNNSDCGTGTVYLEKVTESDFKKEDFVVKYEARTKKTPAPKKPAAKKTLPTAKNPTAGNSAPKKHTAKAPAPSQLKAQPKKPSSATTAPTSKPQTSKPPQQPDRPQPAVTDQPHSAKNPQLATPSKPLPPVPKIMMERENKLVKKIDVYSNSIKIEIYDNGYIDNDTVSVYHNNELVIAKQRLTHEPIVYNISADAGVSEHEIVLVAENLGEIAPNTALMVVTAGDKRYELNIVSSEEKNARILIRFHPQQ